MAKNDHDRILWTLKEHGGSMAKGELARRVHMRREELDLVLKELESAKKIQLVEIRGKLVVGLRRRECYQQTLGEAAKSQIAAIRGRFGYRCHF